MKLNTLIMTLAIIIALFAANFLAARHPLRIDLTQGNIYTLSEATKKILSELDDVLTIRVYFSEDLPPALQALQRDVDDILDEYKSAAGSMLQVEHIDPASSALEEQKVAMMGIPPLQINVIRRDKQEVAKIYLGIAVMYGSEQKVLPVIDTTRNLEYLLDESILQVSAKELLKIVWWQPRPQGPDDGAGFGMIREAVSQRYEIVDLKEGLLSDLDPKDHKALVLISPRQLGTDYLRAIDEYVIRGGHVIALVDRWEMGETFKLLPVETDITDLLSHYGTTVENTLVLDELSATAAFTSGVVTYHIPYAYWPEVRREGFNQDLPLSSTLSSVIFPWTSPLALTKPEGTQAVVAASSTYAAKVQGDKADLDPNVAKNALKGGNHKRYVLAALTKGPFKSFYAISPAGAEASEGADIVGSEDSRLFVIGSSHWVDNRFLSTFPQNADLLQNAIDSFAMGDLLIGIRTREQAFRPIAIMPDAARLWFRYLNVAAGPMALGIIGIMVFIIRKAHRRIVISRYRSAVKTI